MNRVYRRLCLPLVFCVAVLAHAESLSYWFVSTDVFALIESSRIDSPTDLLGLFVNPMMSGTRFTEVGLFYRPIASLTYGLDYAVWGVDPFGYHLTNLVLHGLAAVLVALSISALLGRPLVGYLSAVAFSLHPLTAEVVPTAARRQDVLLTVFVLAALWLFVRAYRAESRPALAGSILSYLLALGSKEVALLLPLLVAAWVFLRPDLSGPDRPGPDLSGPDRPAGRSGSTARDTVAPGSEPAIDAAPRTRPTALVRSDGGYAGRRRFVDGALKNRIEAAIRETAPFLVVTITYLFVRVLVLSGLGGYEAGSITPGDLVLIPIDYVLSITYHENVIWALVGDSRRWLAVSLAAIALLGIGLDHFAGRSTRLRSRETVARAGFVLGLGSLAFVLAFGPPFVRSFPAEFRYPWVVSVLVGVCFVIGCCSGIAALSCALDSPLAGLGSPLAFLGLWLASPLALFYLAGEFTMRSGYPFLAPAMALLSLLGVESTRAIRRRATRTPSPTSFSISISPSTPSTDSAPNTDSTRFSDTDRSIGAHAMILCLVSLLVLPQMALSPLFYSYDGWQTAGEVNHRTLAGLSAELDGAPADAQVVISGLPGGVGDQRRAFPRVESIGFLQENSIESWLRLRDPGAMRHVSVASRDAIPHAPDTISFETTPDNGRITIEVRYRSDG